MIAMRRGLSPRAIRALELAARDGVKVDDIAYRLDVSPATVDLDLRACREFYDTETTTAAYIAHVEHAVLLATLADILLAKRPKGRRTRRKPGAPSMELFG